MQRCSSSGARAIARQTCWLLLLVGAGCTIDPDRDVALYRSVIGADEMPVPLTPGQPLSLRRALELANQHNERLGLQGEAYLRALIEKDRAAAAFLPTVSLSAAYSFRDADRSEDGQTASSDSDFASTIVGQQSLFRGFRDLNEYRSAEKTAEQRRALLLDAQASVLIDVARVFYQIMLAERSVEVLANSLSVQDARVRETQARQRAGLAKPLDVAQTEAQAAATRVQLIDARRDVATGRSVLAQLVGAPVQSSPLVDDLRVPGDIPPLEELQQRAVAGRQDLAAARRAVEAAKIDVQAAIGRYFPSVSLNLNYFLAKPEKSDPGWWNGVLAANLPIFSAGQIEADVRLAWSNLRSAALSESQISRQVSQEVETAYQEIISSVQQLEALQVQVRAAEQSLRLAEGLYDAGEGTNLDRLTAQDALLNAQLRLTHQQVNHKLFYLQLLRAIGALSTSLPGEQIRATATQPALVPQALPATMPVMP